MVTQNKQTRNLPAGFKQNKTGEFETTQAVVFNDDFILGSNITIILKDNLTVDTGKKFTNNGTVIIEPGKKIINNGNYINNGTTSNKELRESAAAGSAPSSSTAEQEFIDFLKLEKSNVKHSIPNTNSFSLGITNEYMKELDDILTELTNTINNKIPTGQTIFKNELEGEKTALTSLINQTKKAYNSDATILSNDEYTRYKFENYRNKSKNKKDTVIGNYNLDNLRFSDYENTQEDKPNIIVGDYNCIHNEEYWNNIIFGYNNFYETTGNENSNSNIIFGSDNNLWDNTNLNNIIFGSHMGGRFGFQRPNKAVFSASKNVNLLSKIAQNNDKELLINNDLLPAIDKTVNLGSSTKIFNDISVKKLNNKFTLGNFEGSDEGKIVTLDQNGVINFEKLNKNLNLRETRNTFNNQAWFSNNNGKTDLGRTTNQFQNLYLSEGIKIKNKNVIEYPFEGGKSVGVVLNGLVINSNSGKSKNLPNGNITSDIIINSGGRLSIPANKTLKFTENASVLLSKLGLTDDGDYIENIFISGPNINILKNDNKTINPNKVTANNTGQYVFVYHNKYNTTFSKTITNDSSVNMIIRRINNKAEVAFRNTNQTTGF